MSTDQVKVIGDIATEVEKLMKENPNIKIIDICKETSNLQNQMINGLLRVYKDKDLAQTIVNEMIYYFWSAYNFPIKEPKKIW